MFVPFCCCAGWMDLMAMHDQICDGDWGTRAGRGALRGVRLYCLVLTGCRAFMILILVFPDRHAAISFVMDTGCERLVVDIVAQCAAALVNFTDFLLLSS